MGQGGIGRPSVEEEQRAGRPFLARNFLGKWRLAVGSTSRLLLPVVLAAVLHSNDETQSDMDDGCLRIEYATKDSVDDEQVLQWMIPG